MLKRAKNTPNYTSKSGFTIVELLIVVVVIAILAAITIVSYNGVSNRAQDSATQSGLSSLGKQLTTSGTLDSSSYCNSGDAIVASCMNSSQVFSNIPKNTVPATADVVRYYNTNANSPSPTIVAKSKSGNVFLYSNGSVTQITAAQYATSLPGCGGYAMWSATTQLWTSAYISC